MNTTIKFFTGIFFASLLFASCTKEKEAPAIKTDTQIYEISTPVGEGDGDVNDGIVRVNTTIVDQQNNAVAGAQVHLFNASQNDQSTSNAAGLASVKGNGEGTYNYQVFDEEGAIVVDETLDLKRAITTRVDVIE